MKIQKKKNKTNEKLKTMHLCLLPLRRANTEADHRQNGNTIRNNINKRVRSSASSWPDAKEYQYTT